MPIQFPDEYSLTTDLAQLQNGPDFLSIPGNVKNIQRLEDWPAIDTVYLSSATQSQFDAIAQRIDPVSLILEMVKADDFSLLQRMKRLRNLIIDANARLETLDFLMPLAGLEHLELKAIKAPLALQPLGTLAGLETLVLDGGFSRIMKARSVAPLAKLQNVTKLVMTAIRFDDPSLAPLADMRALKSLTLTYYFPTESYAELYAARPDITCDQLAPYKKITTQNYEMDAAGTLVDTGPAGFIVTGKRKPILKPGETDKLERYVKEWDALVAGYRAKL
jgi:hypothetical protein